MMLDSVHFASLEQAALAQTREDASGELAARAQQCARGMVWVPGVQVSQHFARRVETLNREMESVVETASGASSTPASESRWLKENLELLRSQAAMLSEAKNALARTVHVRCGEREILPRPLVIAEDLLLTLKYRLEDDAFTAYVREFQSVVVLRMSELWQLIPALKLLLLEHIVQLVGGVHSKEDREQEIGLCIRSLRQAEQAPWAEVLEPLIVFDEVLRRDPAGAYAQMDADSRDMYRQAVVGMAEHSDCSELEIAELAVSLSRQSLSRMERDPRRALRYSHVGYYLMAEGREMLYRSANVRLPWRDRLQSFLRRYPDEFYLSGIEILTVGVVLVILWSINFGSLWSALFAALALLIPCSQAAVEVMNYLTTSLLQPRMLPKLDFSDGVPSDCTTMVVVPALLLNEQQVRQLVRGLEVRYVANSSANLHFALLTDLADAAEQPDENDPLVGLCGELVRELNRKYAEKGAGGFAMFHRHRVYNPREGVWMGWERKRGKLLDFNKLILGDYDSFPYKVGDLSVLPHVRYVLTLDSDTELPRESAHRLIGTMAHPLCQAVVDPERNVVTQGYGILQPRVGVSVESAARSRLAAIYSGRTGLDIYTRAVSDVYQDLYGEGSFVGKGIYELRTVHRVLDHRFPRNSILSHDLIEGAYTRAGLASDVEVIDHYPSHYSAYIRRKHRWVRGDWQTVEWILSRVPDESRRRVPNPISLISRWKIMDNLRRSVVEPATCILFLLAWTVLPGSPLYWTCIALGIMLAPSVFQFVAGTIRALLRWNMEGVKDSAAALLNGMAGALLSLAFLLHDSLVSTDAIWRTLYRRVISRRRLLEWETAAEAELGSRRLTPLEQYLLGTPILALIIGAGVFFVRRQAFWIALPILLLWSGSKIISVWLDRPPRKTRGLPSIGDEWFLRSTALRTWRYFAEFSNEEHNWLIPDNVQEEPAQTAARVSPTNLGLLLNARQVACELGHFTVSEFVEATRRTLWAMARMQCFRGHLLNWYDTRTLEPLAPLFVSSVDSGNLAASLLTLKSGSLALLHKPLLSPANVEGIADHLLVLAELRGISPRDARRCYARWRRLPLPQRLFAALSGDYPREKSGSKTADARWFADQLRTRRTRLQQVLNEYIPWLLPEFDSLRQSIGFDAVGGLEVPLIDLPACIQLLQRRAAESAVSLPSSSERQQCEALSTLLQDAHRRCTDLIRDLRTIAGEAERWFERMDFRFLVDPRRKLLSIGYDVKAGTMQTSAYDLLASESRTATFLGIAKGEIPQQAWFKLARTHSPTRGGPTLVSWAGTVFEYLMPVLWMRSYRDTMLARSLQSSVAAQQAFGREQGIPWGISESGYSEVEEDGAYRYRAFGIPELALQASESPRLVVAPYASALALAVDPASAAANLRRMAKRGWMGAFGFYEAADFGPFERSRHGEWTLVRSWMAHHQGMILLSIANLLRNNVVQRWFHADERVEATELLLQERRILRHIRPAWHTRPSRVSTRAVALSDTA